MDKMCDFLGKSHEFFLKLKKAGFDDEKIQQVINAKDNALAKVMFEAYLKAAEQDVFELLYESIMPVAMVSESRFLEICRQQFFAESWRFDERLLSIYGQSSALSGWYRAKVYRLKEVMPMEKVRAFIESQGSFPGVFGTASFWMFEALKEKAPLPSYEKFVNGINEVLKTFNESPVLSKDVYKLPQGMRIFGFEEKEMKLNPCLIRFENESPSWYFSLDKTASPDGKVPAKEAFLVLEKISDDDLPHFSEIELQ